jgi:hypothetical protein
MRQFDTKSKPAAQIRALADPATVHQHRMARGLVHGIILSLAVWVAAAYLAVILL